MRVPSIFACLPGLSPQSLFQSTDKPHSLWGFPEKPLPPPPSVDVLPSKGSVGPILQEVTSMPACRPLKEACEEMFSKHFDYCTTASAEFKILERASFMKILWHPHLVVTSEEKFSKEMAFMVGKQ